MSGTLVENGLMKLKYPDIEKQEQWKSLFTTWEIGPNFHYIKLQDFLW